MKLSLLHGDFDHILVIIGHKYAPELKLYIILATLENFESDTFNHEMSLSQAKLVQCSQAMVTFSSDQINILQHNKHIFTTIITTAGARWNMVLCF